MRLAVGLALLSLMGVSAHALALMCVPGEANPEFCVYRVGGVLPCDRELGRLVGVVAYVDNDPCQPGCIFSIWFYQESNGVFWLQRFDEVVDNTCGGLIDGDTIIF